MATTLNNVVLSEALEAHGGLDRWRQLNGMSSTIVSGGSLWALKGIEMDKTARVATSEFHRQRTSVKPFGNSDWTMTWSPERVIIESGAGVAIAERENPRQAFAGHLHDTPWDPLHLAYFNGYAMWTYHALPFVLAEPGYEISEVPAVVQDGQRLRGLSARFPAHVASHCREQRFYFGDDGLLARHDYSVDVWANARAAHLLSDYESVDGFKLPTRRRVHPRQADGTYDATVDLVTIDLSHFLLG